MNFPNLDYKVRMDWVSFGFNLLETLDLDPMYVALYSSSLPMDQKKRWALAYLYYYTSSVASYLSEFKAERFFEEMYRLFPTAPRGMERRHFRGREVFKRFLGLRSFGTTPEEIVDGVFSGVSDSKTAMENAEKLPLVGPWSSWKFADIGERFLGFPISFSDANLSIYSEPVLGAAMILKGSEKEKMTAENMNEACSLLSGIFGQQLAPPGFDRPVNVQEFETIFCKFKAHQHGKYAPGKDTVEVLHSFEHGNSATSRHLFQVLTKALIGREKGKVLQ